MSKSKRTISGGYKKKNNKINTVESANNDERCAQQSDGTGKKTNAEIQVIDIAVRRDGSCKRKYPPVRKRSYEDDETAAGFVAEGNPAEPGQEPDAVMAEPDDEALTASIQEQEANIRMAETKAVKPEKNAAAAEENAGTSEAEEIVPEEDAVIREVKAAVSAEESDEPREDIRVKRIDTDGRKPISNRQQEETIRQMIRRKNTRTKKIRSRVGRRIPLPILIVASLAAVGILFLIARGICTRIENQASYVGGEEIVWHEDLDSQMAVEEAAKDDPAAEEDDELKEDHVFTVCIDPGHGGKDIGANSGERLEKDDVLRLGLVLRDYLEAQGVNVVMTRDTDDFLKLSARCKIANKAKADYLVSLHRNTGKGNGVEAWILTTADEETKNYADAIMTSLESVGISRNRGVKQGTLEGGDTDYSINLNSNMPSCIIELGFLNSTQDNELLDEKLEAYAEGIGKAITATYQAGQDALAGTDEAVEASGLDEAPVDETMAGADGENGEIPAGGTDSKGNVTSIALINEPIDEQSQDATLLEWGQGKNFDELNRPGGCLMYQQKYGDMSAYFLGPWEEGEQKVIYLTFDIGYTNEYTISILDTLKKKQVKAVFFATLPVFEDEPAIVKRIINEGHELANHSVTHPAAGLPSQTVEEQRAEIMDVHNLCLEKYGYTMHLFRFPAGKFSEQSLAIANNCNYRSVFWSWAHMDWNTENQPDVQTSLNAAVERLHPGAIYLLHGISSTNAEMLGDLIDAAREQGYEFALLQ